MKRTRFLPALLVVVLCFTTFSCSSSSDGAPADDDLDAATDMGSSDTEVDGDQDALGEDADADQDPDMDVAVDPGDAGGDSEVDIAVDSRDGGGDSELDVRVDPTDGGSDSELDVRVDPTDGGSDADVSREVGLLTDRTIDVDGVARQYHVFVPDNYVDAPIVLLFHGHSRTNDDLLGLSGDPAPYRIWLDIAAEDDVIVVAPNGLFVSEDEKGWNDCRAEATTNSTADDVAFTETLIDFMVETYDADAARVYAQGTSNGGHLSIRLAEEMPDRLTAFAAVVAANAVNSECGTSDVPVSALFMNGTADPLLPFEGGQMAGGRGEVLSAQDTIAYWVSRNGTDTTPELFEFPDLDASDDSTVERATFSNGEFGTEVVLYRVVGGGHMEPSAEERVSGPAMRILGNQNADIEMAREVWAFFERQSR